MENFEYTPDENPTPEPEVIQAPKKASPFADSPYEFQAPAYEAPKKVKKQKKAHSAKAEWAKLPMNLR